jgi:hypothetical protein
MSAIITDQFRLENANNFVKSVENTDNSYYISVGLSNPNIVGFGRTEDWDSNTPNPIDNFSYQSHFRDTIMFGKKVSGANIRRVVRKIDWIRNTRYEMYRHDYGIENPAPISQSTRLYDSNYYVINSDYSVYICLDNGSSGINTLGGNTLDEPKFTDLDPSRAGISEDGYIWKYLFTVSPSDIIKFDSTEYITLPPDWENSNNSQIQSVRENGDSELNNNQIKKVYIENSGSGYTPGTHELNIIGDGEGGKVIVEVDDQTTRIVDVIVSSGGKNYTFAMVDLGPISPTSGGIAAKLIPIIPPSKGHGYDIYKELGADRVLLYSRFDSSTRDFPTDSKFSQIGILKNPQVIGSGSTFTDNEFSSLYGIKFSSASGSVLVGDIVRQTTSTGEIARGYVSSYDSETKVLKYSRDRSLYYNNLSQDETDYIGISTSGKVIDFQSTTSQVTSIGGFNGIIDTEFVGMTTLTGTKIINLGTQFANGLAFPEINKMSGELIYIDNRPLVSRNLRQKEDIKIILEF